MTSPALPPLPEPAQVSYVTDSVMRRHEVRSFTASQTLAYGQQCRDEALEAVLALLENPNDRGDWARAVAYCMNLVRALKTTPPQGEL